MDVTHEKMQRMKKEMSRLESVAKNEQWKHTLAEQRLEQKMQEGMTVFNKLMSKLPPNAFASKTSAITSKMQTSQLMPAELLKKATEKDPTPSTEQQERSPRSATDLPAESQILSASTNNDIVNTRRYRMINPSYDTSEAGEETDDLSAAFENVF